MVIVSVRGCCMLRPETGLICVCRAAPQCINSSRVLCVKQPWMKERQMIATAKLQSEWGTSIQRAYGAFFTKDGLEVLGSKDTVLEPRLGIGSRCHLPTTTPGDIQDGGTPRGTTS